MNLKTVITLCLLTFACGSEDEHPNAEVVFQQYAEAACKKMSACLGSNFLDYYTSEKDCSDKAMTLFDNSKKGKPSTCSSQEVDTCTGDVRNTSCVGKSSPADFNIPESCKKC